MTHRITLAIAAALAVGSVSPSWAKDRPQPDAEKIKEPNQAAALPAGITSQPYQVDNDDVYDTFEDLTKAAVKRGTFPDAVERLVDQDRNRIGKDMPKEFGALEAQIARVSAAWTQKYNDSEVNVSDEDFRTVPVVRGEVQDPKQVASNWPLPAVTASAGGAEGDAVQAAASEEKTTNDKPDLDSNIEKGRNVAIATIPASHGLPALNVSLIREAKAYRIDAPNTLTGQRLNDNLVKHLTHVADNAAQWPTDRREAARMLTHHVLMAVYDVDVPAGQQKQQQDKQSTGPSGND